MFYSALSTANLDQISNSPRLALYFILFTLLPHPSVAYNPSTINNSSQIIPPAQQVVKIPKNICTLLNEDATKKDKEHVTAEYVNAKFPEICTKTTENTTVTMSCHCEITLALRALKSKCTSTPIKIGVSKRICWLCEKYLKFLSHSQNVRILVSEYQGKIHAGWRIPEYTPEDVKTKMHILVHEQVTEIRESIINRRKSDSFPPEDHQLIEKIIDQPQMLNCFERRL